MTWPHPTPARNASNVAPFGPPIKAFVGRSVDSSFVREIQAPVRTFRARIIRDAPELNRIFQIQGARMCSYIRDRFFARLAAHEPLTTNAAGNTLQPDFSFMLPEGPGAGRTDGQGFFQGWKYDRTDGQDRLWDFDYDGRGNVYVAFDPYGAGILGPDLQSVHQFRDDQENALAAKRIRAFRSAGRYYVSVYPSFDFPRVYDVTDPSAPVLTPFTPTDPPPRTRESSASDFTLKFGPELAIGGYGNVRLYKGGVEVPCLVPGTDRQYFASFYSKGYARGGGFNGPEFSDLFGGETMTDARLLIAPDGRLILVVATGGLCDWYEIATSGTQPRPKPPAAVTIQMSGRLAVGSLVRFSVDVAQGSTVSWRFSDGHRATGASLWHRIWGTGPCRIEAEVNSGAGVTLAETTVVIA